MLLKTCISYNIMEKTGQLFGVFSSVSTAMIMPIESMRETTEILHTPSCSTIRHRCNVLSKQKLSVPISIGDVL